MDTPNVDMQTIQVSLPGLTTPIYARYDYTSSQVSDAFSSYLRDIMDVFELQADPNANPPVTLTADDAAKVSNALSGLYTLASQGLPNPPQDGVKTSYLNTDMAASLDALTRTFMAAGFPIPAIPAIGFAGIPGNSDPVAALSMWKDLSTLSPIITNILQAGLNTSSTNRSLQAMIELEYVQNANDLLEAKMGDLESALGTTNDVLNTLAALQDLHNKITVSDKPSINFDYLSAQSTNYVNAYTAVASNYFGGPIVIHLPILGDFVKTSTLTTVFGAPVLNYSTTDFNFNSTGLNYVNNLIKYRASIASEIAQLDTQLTQDQKEATGSLYSTLKNVLKDIDSTFQANGQPITAASSNLDKYNGLTKWLIDNYNSRDSTTAGSYQENISKAITAAQSLNDTQKEDVRNYLFVFEEYYKSASAVLQKITDIIQRMAQGIRS